MKNEQEDQENKDVSRMTMDISQLTIKIQEMQAIVTTFYTNSQYGSYKNGNAKQNQNLSSIASILSRIPNEFWPKLEVGPGHQTSVLF